MRRYSGSVAESLLFGHVRRAFTGAEKDQPGAFERAASGTLFLDEIGDLSLELQVKLFRVLEDGTFTPVGGNHEKSVDVRILAATNADLQSKMAGGEFREELYFRIAGFPIFVPPLRERTADILPLADHLLSRLASEMGIEKPVLSSGALADLTSYPFPGNVRELKNIIEQAIIESPGQTIRSEHLHFTQSPAAGANSADESFLMQEIVSGKIGYSEAVSRFQQQAVMQVLEACSGDRAEAANRLQIHRPNLNRLIKRLAIDDSTTNAP